MKKQIRIRMTRERANEMGVEIRPGYVMGLVPVEMDLDAMTPAAAWIAQHITSTYVIDELRDQNGIAAIAGFSMMERDKAAGKSEECISAKAKGYLEYYTTKPMRIDEITFPIYGRAQKRPEDVIETTVDELRRAGAVRLEARNGDTFEL